MEEWTGNRESNACLKTEGETTGKKTPKRWNERRITEVPRHGAARAEEKPKKRGPAGHQEPAVGDEIKEDERRE